METSFATTVQSSYQPQNNMRDLDDISFHASSIHPGEYQEDDYAHLLDWPSERDPFSSEAQQPAGVNFSMVQP